MTQSWQIGGSSQGPWTPTTMGEIAQRAEKGRYNKSYADETNGIVVFAKTPAGVILQITDQEAIHGEDTIIAWEVCSINEDDGLSSGFFLEADDDLFSLLQRAEEEGPDEE